MRLVFFLGLPGLWARVQDRLRYLPWGGFRATASSPGHRYPVEALLVRRDRLLRERVMYFALAFGLLTPLWILMDVWAFPKSLWPQMMWLRLLTSVAFLFLFVHAARGLECRNVGRSYTHVYRQEWWARQGGGCLARFGHISISGFCRWACGAVVLLSGHHHITWSSAI